MSVQQRLQKIDQSLIDLLSQRISLLADSDRPDLLTSLVSDKEKLAQARVPESVWEALVTGCTAAALRKVKPSKPSACRQITLVGGQGVIGKFFRNRLEAAGNIVKILEAEDWDNAETLLTGSDLVLLCVPLKVTAEVVERLAPYLSPTTVLADVASIKAPVCRAMLAAHKGPVVGLHPMFGPGSTSFIGQKVIVCPGRGHRAYQWFLEYIKAEGGHLITCSPEEHDHMMVAIQAIRHFSTFCLGVFLTEEGIDIDRSLEFSTLIYRIEADMIGRLFAQDAELYVEIMLASQERLAAINRLSETYQRLAHLIQAGDRTALLAEFAAARPAFHPETGRAMTESNYLIQSLSHFLAAEGLKQPPLRDSA